MLLFDLVKSKEDNNVVRETIVETSHTLKEWNEHFKKDDAILWNFPKEELLDGTVEPQPFMIYWLIGNRLYETTLAEPLDKSNNLYFRKLFDHVSYAFVGS